MREAVGETAWDMVDGVSIHPYCGDVNPETLCTNLPTAASAIRDQTGKTKIFASEWAASRRFTGGKIGLPDANVMAIGLEQIVKAQIDTATYWPPTRVVRGIALVTDDLAAPTATGLVFGEMARTFHGRAMKTAGDIPIAAALHDDGALGIVIPSMRSGEITVNIRLPSGRWTRVVQAETVIDGGETAPNAGKIVPARATLSDEILSITLNHDKPGWEVAAITLQ